MKPELQLLCEISAQLEAPVPVGDTPEGLRRVVPITRGTFEGPRMKGILLPGGADWQLVRPDGVTVVEALYLLCTDDAVVDSQLRDIRNFRAPESRRRRKFLRWQQSA